MMWLLMLSLVMPGAPNTIAAQGAGVHTGDLKSARMALDRVAPYSHAQDPIARFTDPICAVSAGLPDTANHAIVERVEKVAASAGLRVGAPGCAPNLFVLFVADGASAVRRLAKTNSAALSGQSLEDIRRIVAQPAPVKAWTEVEWRSRDGDRPSYHPDKTPTLKVSTSSRLSSIVRRDIVSSSIMIDKDVAAGLPLRQLADYAAVRALTGARPDGNLGGRSILSLFAADTRNAPPERTAFDRGYLRGLYEGAGDFADVIKRAEIAERIARFESRAGEEVKP